MQTDVAFRVPNSVNLDGDDYDDDLVSFDDFAPRFVNVSHPLWIRTAAKIEHFKRGRSAVPSAAFDLPKACRHLKGGDAAEETGDDWKPVSVVVAACVGLVSAVALLAAKATSSSSSSSSLSASSSIDERLFWKLAAWVVYLSVTAGCWVVSSTWVGLHEGIYCYYFESGETSTASCNGCLGCL